MQSEPFENIAGQHSTLLAAASAEIAEWLPLTVPPTIGLGVLGCALVEREREFDDEALDRIALCVEGFLSRSGPHADAVATGFLEAICHQSLQEPASVERIVLHLGARAVAYVRAWDDFTGVATPGVQRAG